MKIDGLKLGTSFMIILISITLFQTKYTFETRYPVSYKICKTVHHFFTNMLPHFIFAYTEKVHCYVNSSNLSNSVELYKPKLVFLSFK